MATGEIAPKIANPIKAAAANTVFSNDKSTTAIPAFNTLTSIIDNAIGSTQGEILYRGASAWTVLPHGTSGQLLETQGASANPQWTTVVSGVSSVSNSDGTLTISPTTGAVVASLAALTSAHILVGNGSNVATSVALSGDGTLSNTGAITVTKTNGTAFGTAATDNTGTSGATIPLLNGTNTWSGAQTFNTGIVIGATEIVATTEYNNGNSSTSATINFNNGNQQKITLTGNCTFTFTAPTTGVTSIRLRIVQGSGGPYTITWPTMTWASGIKPPTSVGAAIDIAALEYSTIDSAYFGVASLNFF
jgi:hypothetical protein